eukprot:36334-Rhodomonas_salina.2
MHALHTPQPATPRWPFPLKRPYKGNAEGVPEGESSTCNRATAPLDTVRHRHARGGGLDAEDGSEEGGDDLEVAMTLTAR